MPLSKYFRGHGNEVMDSIRKAHPNASDEKVKSEFYATANSRPGMKPASEGKRKTVGSRLAALAK